MPLRRFTARWLPLAMVVVAAGAGATACTGPADPAPAAGAVPALDDEEFRVLQMNLCNGGDEPGCYRQGRAVQEAVTLIASVAPDLVTVQEVCRRDVDELLPALAAASSREVVSAFTAGRHTDGEPLTCPDGDELGVGVLLATPTAEHQVFSGHYVTQSVRDDLRPYACLYAVAYRYACVTHLTPVNRSVALEQCAELLDEIVPAMQVEVGADLPTVVAGDLNLRERDDAESVDTCVPGDYTRRGDGDVQHVVASRDASFLDSRTEPMEYTDHPALVAVLAVPPPQNRTGQAGASPASN